MSFCKVSLGYNKNCGGQTSGYDGGHTSSQATGHYGGQTDSHTSSNRGSQTSSHAYGQSGSHTDSQRSIQSDSQAGGQTGACSVCGDSAHHHQHYGAVCCYSCRAFFRRTVSSSRNLVCSNGRNNCKITVKTRTCCKKCRYLMCIEAGMDPNLVDAAARRKIQTELSQQSHDPVWHTRIQERKTDYSSPVERVKYNDFNHIRKYNQGQFDHLSERRIPTRSSSTSRLPIQDRKEEPRPHMASIIVHPNLTSNEMQLIQKVELLNKKKEEIEQELNNCRKSLKRQKNLQQPSAYIETNYPNKPSTSSYNLTFGKQTKRIRSVYKPDFSNYYYPPNLQDKRHHQSKINKFGSDYPSRQITTPEERFRPYPDKIISTRHAYNQTYNQSLYGKQFSSNNFQNSPKIEKKRFRNFEEGKELCLGATKLVCDPNKPCRCCSESFPITRSRSKLILNQDSNETKTDCKETKIWCPYESVETEKVIKAPKRISRSNYHRKSGHNYVSETSSVSDNTARALQAYLIPEVSNSNTDLLENQYPHSNAPVWNSSDQYTYGSALQMSEPQEHRFEQSTFDDNARMPHQYSESADSLEQECCSVVTESSGGFSGEPINHFYIVSSKDTAASTIKNTQTKFHDTLSSETVISPLVRGRSTVSSTSTCSWNSVDSMRNEVETPMLEDLDEFCDLNIESLLQDKEEGQLGTKVLDDTSDKDDDSETSTEDEEEEDIIELEEDVDSIESPEPVAEKKKTYNLPSFDGNKDNIPLKKQKRMRQVRYPKSRFINWRKIPIFDLTVEEEFRIHNLNFRRELVYKEYCIKMKDRYPSIEEYKSLIFLSTFGQKRVVIDPNIFNLYADNAHKTHSYCVPIYDEIKSIPQHVWENIRGEISKTWFTYGWALCWANVDSEDLIDQESKAGFWDQEIQVIYDKLFPNNPKALKTLNMEDWDCFSSPWASSALDEETFAATMTRVGNIAGKDRLLSTLYGLLIHLTPDPGVDPEISQNKELNTQRRDITRLMYRYLKSKLESTREADRMVRFYQNLEDMTVDGGGDEKFNL